MAMHRPLGSALLVSEHFPPAFGGTPVLFENVYRRLTGLRVRVLADDKFTVSTPAMLHTMEVHRRHLHSAEWGVLTATGLLQHLRIARWIRQLSDRQTIVHCGRALPEGVAALFSMRPYIVWVHGEDLTCAEQSRELTAITRLVLQRAGRVLANSRNTATMLRPWGVDEARIRIVYPAVDATRFTPSVDGRAVRQQLAPAGGPLILSVGRLQRRKGHDLAIAAVAKVRDRFPGLRYAIVGDGDERARLEGLAHQHAVADRVVFVGEVADADLPAYYAAADVFLLPNRIEQKDIEGFGIVFLEAAASGRPVIAGNSGGVPEAVADGHTGQLVSGVDVSELADALARLAGDPELRHAMGTAGRQRVMERFTWERAAADVRRAHEDLAGGVATVPLPTAVPS